MANWRIDTADLAGRGCRHRSSPEIIPLVLKPGLVIFSIYNGYWFWGRPSFEDLRRDLREATRQIRPAMDRSPWPPVSRLLSWPVAARLRRRVALR